MVEDLSTQHGLIGDLFALPASAGEWARHLLGARELSFYEENGFLAPVRMLDDEQVEALRRDLAELMDHSHPGHHLFYEYHSNESKDTTKVVFHALGAWRITVGDRDKRLSRWCEKRYRRSVARRRAADREWREDWRAVLSFVV
ncbi:MAG TPA: hypothetical protein VKA70_18685 [Blastocatellia bacterium]|nr:hypothetical protein [Blastocatellia bacterium]